MTAEQTLTKKVLSRLMNGRDYRSLVIQDINEKFLRQTIDFFMKVCEAKANNQEITIDWYKANFIKSEHMSKGEVIINSGLNQKTITNIYKSCTREIALQVSEEHYDDLLLLIESLIEEYSEIDITLTIRFNRVAVELTVNESLIVINAIAVKRSALRGGAWSMIGKQVEKPLMLSLCELFGVTEEYYETKSDMTGYPVLDSGDPAREVDFLLKNGDMRYNCEVKLMGKGNPESEDSAYARVTHLFVAQTLSQANKERLDSSGIKWIELSSVEGISKFKTVLTEFGIPHNDIQVSEQLIGEAIDKIMGS